MRYRNSLVIAGLLLGSSASALALDGSRQGFLIGLGAGLDAQTGKMSQVNQALGTDRDAGWVTSFRIGYGFNDQFLLYLMRENGWYSKPMSNGSTQWNETISLGVTGPGATLFFDNLEPGLYALAGLGLADYSAPFNGDMNSDFGFGWLAGVGYELAPRVGVEARVLSATVDSNGGSDRQYTSNSLQLTFHYTWY